MSGTSHPRLQPTLIKFLGAEVRDKSKGPTLAFDQCCCAELPQPRSGTTRCT